MCQNFSKKKKKNCFQLYAENKEFFVWQRIQILHRMCLFCPGKSKVGCFFKHPPHPTALPQPPPACLQPRPPALLVWADRPSSVVGNPLPWTCDCRDEMEIKWIQHKTNLLVKAVWASKWKCLQVQAEFPEKPDSFSSSDGVTIEWTGKPKEFNASVFYLVIGTSQLKPWMLILPSALSRNWPPGTQEEVLESVRTLHGRVLRLQNTGLAGRGRRRRGLSIIINQEKTHTWEGQKTTVMNSQCAWNPVCGTSKHHYARGNFSHFILNSKRLFCNSWQRPTAGRRGRSSADRLLGMHTTIVFLPNFDYDVDIKKKSKPAAIHVTERSRHSIAIWSNSKWTCSWCKYNCLFSNLVSYMLLLLWYFIQRNDGSLRVNVIFTFLWKKTKRKNTINKSKTVKTGTVSKSRYKSVWVAKLTSKRHEIIPSKQVVALITMWLFYHYIFPRPAEAEWEINYQPQNVFYLVYF